MARMRGLLTIVLALFLAAPIPTLAQEATPAAGEVQQFADDTYALVSGGSVSMFIVTDDGVVATDPASLDPASAEAYAVAIASVTDQPVR